MTGLRPAHAQRPRLLAAVVLAGGVGLLAGAGPAAAKPAPGTLGLFVQDAGPSKGVTTCGVKRSAAVVDTGTSPFLTSSANPRAKIGRTATLRLQRCEGGRWVAAPSAKLRKRVAIPTGQDADLRYTARGISRYVRVGTGPVTERPVSFSVVNEDRTPVDCPVDGRTYTVRGHIIGPASSFEPGGEGHVTLYDHGHSFSEELWRYRAVPGYDLVGELAQRGHTSVTFDRLGYESSDKPPGHASCYASDADVTHQMIQKLRTGDYTVEGYQAPAFAKVALVGHSQATISNEILMSAFPQDRPDALVHLSFVSAFLSVPLAVNFENNVEDCELTTTHHADDDPGAPDGYAPRGRTDASFVATNFYDADPRVVADTTAKRNVDPCGFPETVLDAVAQNQITDTAITDTPILVGMGDHDSNFNSPPTALAYQSTLYGGGAKTEIHLFKGSGHALMLERKGAPEVRDVVGDFLERHGF